MSPTFTNSPYSMASAATPCTDPCVSTCPSCGGLQCLCRPRFFAGQLLTEDDLSLLNNYIVEKNKLHNRYLHGWGVVCGMEVVCSPCNNLVTVKSGYALSPCGEDIIVCQDTPVNICALVQKCKTQAPSDCQPLALGAQDTCSSTTEDWILFIRYSETMSRGVTPLKGASGNSCTTNCGCGGTSGCGCGGKSGCGCGGSATSKSNGNGKSNGCNCGCSGSKTTTQTSTAVAQCEPTAVCEGYTFDVCKAPVQDRKTVDRGALVNRVLCCFEAILPSLTLPPQDPTLWQQWCCSLRQNLLTFFAANPIHDCQIGTLLANMCSPNNQDPRMAVAQILWEYALDCICSAFLPPCPCPVSDDRVPIATITIQKTPANPCQLVKVCNLDVRKFCTTFPALQYWLSPFGSFARGLRTGLASLCCTIPPIPPVNIDRPQQNPQINIKRAAIEVPPNPMTEFSNFIVSSFLERSQSVDAQHFALASLGLTHDGGQAFMSAADLSHPFEAIFLNQVAWPVLETALPSNVSGVLREVIASAGQTGAAPAGDSTTTLNNLKSQINDLQSALKQHQSKLDELQKELKKK